MQTSKTKLTPWISAAVLIYFVILFAERTQSVVRVLRIRGLFFADAFEGYVNLLTVLSLAATAILLAIWNGAFWRSLAGGAAPDYTRLSVTAGVLLLSGMVHTEYTIAPLQFVAYGALIAALILRTAQTAHGQGKAQTWYSLVYLISFSMAIPVVYRAVFIPRCGLFHVLEAVTAVVLVAFFTIMTCRVFLGEAEDLLQFTPLIVAVVADAAILAWRWQETVNTFVLIFAALTLILFIIGKLLFRKRA